MRQSNGCSTPAPRSSAAKQWFQQLAQKNKKNALRHVHHMVAAPCKNMDCGALLREEGQKINCKELCC